MSIYQSTKVMPYVYWLTHKVTGQFYIGYREINEVTSDQDLGFFYWTSSKIVEPIFSEFDIQIIAEFFDGDSAYDFENRTIEANIKNPLCLNGHYTKAGKIRFKSKKGNNLGKIRSQETKLKLSISHKGNKHSDETKFKMSQAHKDKVFSSETRAKISLIHKDKIISSETRAKISSANKGKIRTNETRIKKSMSTQNVINLKTWTILKESDNSIIEIKVLKIWCKSQLVVSYSSLLKTFKSQKFHKGYKIISKE